MGIVVPVNSGFPQATECFRKLSIVWASALENVRKTGKIQRISVSRSAKLLTWLVCGAHVSPAGHALCTTFKTRLLSHVLCMVQRNVSCFKIFLQAS